jgi:hypothetical protein
MSQEPLWLTSADGFRDRPETVFEGTLSEEGLCLHRSRSWLTALGLVWLTYLVAPLGGAPQFSGTRPLSLGPLTGIARGLNDYPTTQYYLHFHGRRLPRLGRQPIDVSIDCTNSTLEWTDQDSGTYW